MTTRSTEITLTAQGATYAEKGPLYAEIGDSVVIKVITNMTYGSPPNDADWVNHTSGSTYLIGTSTTGGTNTNWTLDGTVPGSAHSSAGTGKKALFYSPSYAQGNADGTTGQNKGKVSVIVPNPIMGTATYNNPNANSVTVTVVVTPCQGSGSTGYVRYKRSTDSTWVQTNTFSQTRGTNVTYQAEFYDVDSTQRAGGSANYSAKASAGSTTTTNAVVDLSNYYIAPTTTGTLSDNTPTASGGTYSVNMTGSYNANDTHFLTTSATTFSYSSVKARTEVGSSLGNEVFVNAPGSTVSSPRTANISTTAQEGSSETLYLWVNRWNQLGGNDVAQRISGQQVEVSVAAAGFTATTESLGAYEGNDYYDHSSNDPGGSSYIRHRQKLSGLNTGGTYRYGVSTSGSSYTRASYGNRTDGNDAEWKSFSASTSDIKGATSTAPSVGDSQTFYLWRSLTSNPSTRAAVVDSSNNPISWTRRLVAEDSPSFSVSSMSIPYTATSATFQIGGTFQGHVYRLYDGTTNAATIRSSDVIGNGGVINISPNNVSSIQAGSSNAVTYYLFVQSFQSRLSATMFYTGSSITVTRLNSDGGTSSTIDAPAAGQYGFAFRNGLSATTYIMDSGSFVARCIAKGTSGSVAARSGSDPGEVTITGLPTTVTRITNASTSPPTEGASGPFTGGTDDVSVILIAPAVLGNDNSYRPWNYRPVKITTGTQNSFKIQNNMDAATTFQWEVLELDI